MRALTPLKKYRIKVVIGPLLKAVECGCELAIPFLVRAIIDQGLNENGEHYGDYGFVFGLCGLVFALSIIGFLMTMFSQYMASRVSTDYAFDLRCEVYRHIGKLSPIQIESFGRSKVLNIINNSTIALQSGVQMFMRLLVRAPLLVIGSVIASFLVNVYAGIVVVSALLLCFLAAFVVAKITPPRYKLLNDGLDKINKEGYDAISGARVIRAFNKQDDEKAEFGRLSEDYRKQGLGIARISAFVNPLTFGLVSLAIILIVYLGSFAVDITGISVGSIVALISFLTQSLTALIQFTKLMTSMSKAIEANSRVNSIFDVTPLIEDGGLKKEDAIADSPIFELKGAGLTYGGQGYALKDIDFHIDDGERVGIIGGTGSGKSSIVSLMLRFLDASEGKILYRGHDLREYDLSVFRSDMSVVSQKKQLFAGTIRENLLLGQDPGDEEIESALKKALAYDFVMEKDGGLDARVEENGSNFSGGQKQRLLIARAILGKGGMLILDDATSALDYRSDKTVRENVFSLGKALLIISQRATSVANCDRIYVLDQGRVAGVGKHGELLKTCPIYADIYNAQVNGR